MTKAQNDQVIVNVNDNWETPPKILQDACRKYKAQFKEIKRI